MKRFLILLICCAILASLFAGCAHAEEHNFAYDSYDSRVVPEAIKETPAYQENKTALRLYWWEVRDFVDYDSVEDVMENCGSYYLVKSSTHWYKYLIESGNVSQGRIWEGAKPYTTHDVINAVSPNISIENIYYFYSALGYADYTLAIYYKTNMGDYVYFSALEYDPMLMAAEQYFDFIRAWYKYQKKQEELRGTPFGARYALPGDWSVYDWSSPHFDPDAPLPIEKDEPEFPWMIVGIGAAVLTAAAVTTVLIIRKKKKKAETTAEVIPDSE